jgi:hypothetical protein
MGDTVKTCCGQCRTRYVATTRTEGWVDLRYTPRERQACDECCETKAEAAGGE